MNEDLFNPANWKYTSPEEEGFHTIISPDNSACKITWVFRLNKRKGDTYTLVDGKLELNGVVIKGKVKIIYKSGEELLNRLDSFYLPSKEKVEMVFQEDTSVFIGGAVYEGLGEFFTRKFNTSLPLGNIRQVHGKPPYRRDVFMTVTQQDNASRLICGISKGEPGQWTSWPPHQHTKDLEEIYCYFDIPKPLSAFHFSSRKEGEFEFIHPVSTGDCVIIPEGYHPTAGMPGVRSCYFWVMAAHSHESRRYDLAVNDPTFTNIR